ncbi:LOW QUALITY PROTEIN: hypothetical protein HID58_022462, partial [Brassica napus]
APSQLLGILVSCGFRYEFMVRLYKKTLMYMLNLVYLLFMADPRLPKIVFFLITCLPDLGCLSRFKLFSGARCRTKHVLMWVSTSSISFGEAFFQLSLWWLCILGSILLVLWSFFSSLCGISSFSGIIFGTGALAQLCLIFEYFDCQLSFRSTNPCGSDGFPADFYILTWDIFGPDFVVRSDVYIFPPIVQNMVASDSRPMRLRLRAELFLASFAVREESIHSEEGVELIFQSILKSRLSRREQSGWNIIDDTTYMAFFEEFSSLNSVFHTFLFYGRLPSPFSRERARNDLLKDHKVLKWQAFLGGSIGFCERDALNYHRKANCLLDGRCMSGNVHVRFREKGGGQKWSWRNPLLSSSMGSFFFGRVCQHDLNEVWNFASDIRWASLFGKRLPPGVFVQ